IPEVARVLGHPWQPDEVGDIESAVASGAEKLMLEEAVPPDPRLIDDGCGKDMRVSEAQVLSTGTVAARVQRKQRNGVVGLRVEHVAAVDAVLIRKAVIEAADILVLIDRRGGAGRAIVDRRFAGVWRGDEAQELRRVALDPGCRDAVAGKGLPRCGIEYRYSGTGEVARAIGRGRHKRRATERAGNLSSGFPVEKEERPLLALQEFWDQHRSADVGAELVAIEPGRLGVAGERLKGR